MATCSASTSQNGTLPLFDHLGKWRAEPHTPSKWLYSPSSRCLYQSSFQGHYQFIQRTNTRALIYKRESFSDDPIPADVCPATAYLNHWGLAVCTGWAEWDIPQVPMISMIQDLINSWDAAWPLHRSDFSQAADIAMAIRQHNAWACADGSYMPNLSNSLAMAAW